MLVIIIGCILAAIFITVVIRFTPPDRSLEAYEESCMFRDLYYAQLEEKK